MSNMKKSPDLKQMVERLINWGYLEPKEEKMLTNILMNEKFTQHREFIIALYDKNFSYGTENS